MCAWPGIGRLSRPVLYTAVALVACTRAHFCHTMFDHACVSVGRGACNQQHNTAVNARQTCLGENVGNESVGLSCGLVGDFFLDLCTYSASLVRMLWVLY